MTSPRVTGLSERGWRVLGLAIWAGVIAMGVFGLALFALSWRDLRTPTLDLPDIGLPEISIPDLGTFRLESEAPTAAKPGPTPEGMSPADDISDAEPVNADRLDD